MKENNLQKDTSGSHGHWWNWSGTNKTWLENATLLKRTLKRSTPKVRDTWSDSFGHQWCFLACCFHEEDEAARAERRTTEYMKNKNPDNNETQSKKNEWPWGKQHSTRDDSPRKKIDISKTQCVTEIDVTKMTHAIMKIGTEAKKLEMEYFRTMDDLRHNENGPFRRGTFAIEKWWLHVWATRRSPRRLARHVRTRLPGPYQRPGAHLHRSKTTNTASRAIFCVFDINA